MLNFLHKETQGRELMHTSCLVIATRPGRDTAGDKIQAVLHSRCMPGPISGGLGAAAFAEPWLESSAPFFLCLPERDQHLLGGGWHSQAEKKINCFPPVTLQVGSRESSPWDHAAQLSFPGLILCLDNYFTRPHENTKAKPSLGQQIAEESKGEDKPHLSIQLVSSRKRNPTSQSLPHDLSSPSGPGNLIGCDTGLGLRKGGCSFSGY